ncbi:protein phosphatase 2C domain-containing protein [Neptunomonas phycophila]|uniref:PP2C family protein-serine/threonine phosphatase n=1 Tax=Neptunomonas phycophila TaxID=1572645 RepID=UPI001BE65455|nr:protein phosphatase 2C domain-containing protein [Neptunomonas phycophila]MBT3145057.1 protein phosphatase 2C domain-containing protein [Neptunomonas phycophila]MDO6785957.1 protein phosphatase 2C domain-containing protein [Neptunomonas phycophila]
MPNLIESSAFSFPKNQDRKNQDSILAPRRLDDGYLLAVADGVGSYPGGDIASKIAIEYLRKITSKEHLFNTEKVLSEIKDRIIQLSKKNESYLQAATTLTFAFINNDGLKVSHIGDCRVYIKEGERLKQLTKDHTQFQKLVDEKAFTKKYLEGTKARSILTTAISPNVEMKADSFFIPRAELPCESNIFNIYIMSDGAHHFWEKRPRFSPNTMNSISQFSNSFKRRIEKLSPIDDYSYVGLAINLT